MSADFGGPDPAMLALRPRDSPSFSSAMPLYLGGRMDAMSSFYAPDGFGGGGFGADALDRPWAGSTAMKDQAAPPRDARPRARQPASTSVPPGPAPAPPAPPKPAQDSKAHDKNAKDQAKAKGKKADEHDGKAAPGGKKGDAAKGGKPKGKAPPGKGKGKAGGGKAGPGGDKMVELIFVHDRKEPVTGPPDLERAPLHIEVDSSSFSAPRSLPFGGVRQPKQPSEAPGPVERDYRALYSDAAEASFQLYRQLDEGARRLADEAESNMRRIADRHADALEENLAQLDSDLDRQRADLAMGRETALADLHDGASALRTKVQGAAARSLGRLDALYHHYLDAMSGPETKRATIESRSSKAVGDLAKNSQDATAKLKSLSGDQSPAHMKESGPWVAPVNEAIDAKLPERAAEEVERFQKMITDVQKPLEKMDHCLPCRFTMAFAGIRAKAANVHEAGPNAILSARDGAIESIENTETQLEDMIERSAAGTDDALVKQHDAARVRATESAKAEAAGESVRLEGAARMQVRTLTAMSIAQPEALQRVVDRLAEEKQRPEQDFGRAAASASERLRGSIAASAARQPAAARAAFVLTIGGLDSQAIGFDLGIARSVADTAKAGGEMVANSLQSFRQESEKGLANLKSLPGSITTQCAHYLDPVDDGYEKAGKELSEAVDSAGAEVEAMITGKAAPTGKKDGKGGADGKGDGKADGPPAAAPAAKGGGGGGAKAVHVKSSLATPPPRVRIPAGGGGAPAAGKGKAAAPPANCAGCNDEAKPAAGKKDEKPSGGDDAMSVEKMIELAGKIAADVLADPPIKEFQGTANEKVTHVMEGHSSKIDTELGSFFPNGDLVVSELRGTTTIQGTAYRQYPPLAGGDGLDERIRTRLWDGWAMPGTIKANIRAAIAALDGHKGDAAFADLEAAFNWSDQNDRSEQALLNLSPPELDSLRDKHGDDLKKMAADLSGADRKKFEALIGLDADGKWLPAAQAAANYNGIKLQEGIKSARDTEGEAGWDKAGEAIGDASRSAGSSRLAGNDDMFGIGSGKKREANDKAQWEATQIAYGKVTGAVAAPTKDGKEPSHADQLAAAQTGMIKQATETITHHHHVSDPEGGDMDWDTVDTVGDRHKLWIERIVKTGPDSNETRAARLGIEFNRQGGKPTRDGLDKALHFGSADAVEGGHYDEKARAAGEAKAKADQDEVLKIYAQDQLDRDSAKDGVCKESKLTPDEIRESLKEKAAKQFGDDTKAKKDALGILSSPHGDALATMELAIGSEKKEIAIKQLQRMDAKEIKKLSDDYAAAHPGEKSLEAQLGINGHHWNWHNWNGATFSGDAANEIEIAFMGVPQNPKERGEVALRVMDQQIDQAGWLGKLLAHDDFDKLTGNAASLRKLMGVSEADVDSAGRIVAHDPQTGLKVKWGNFDENGDFVPPKKGDASAFERAIALSRITADNYVASVDKIANFVATALVVIAAVVTTALTGGAAASIWIPVLVTAAAGVAGMGMKMAIKGGRYSRDEMVTDLVSTVVQAATAGIGAAAGAALRGGAPALKALAGTMRMSEQALGETVALAAGKTAAEATVMRSLSLAEEVAIGAGTSALSGGATAAFDPAARREGDYWGNIFHSMGRGALGGGLGALGGRAGAKGFEFLSKRLGSSVSQTAMKAALAAGKSEAEAIRAGEEAVAKHWASEVGTRAFSSGASGMASRGGELMYDKNVRGMDISYGEMLSEMGQAGLQNFIQGAGEGAADRGMRAISPRRAAEHEWVQQQHALGHPAGSHGDADPGVEMATELAAASHIPTEEAAAPPRPEPPARPEAGGTIAARPREAGEPPRSVLARPELVEAPGPSPLRAPGGDEQIVFRSNRIGAEPPARPGAREEEPIVFRSNRKDGESEPPPGLRRPAPDEEKTNPNIRIPTLEEQVDEAHANAKPGVAEQKISPVFAMADLSQERLKGLAHPLPEGSEIRATDPTSLAAALHNYRMLQEYTPHLEVLLAYNPENGHYVVVQGGPDSVKPPGGSWVTLRHAHPEVYDVTSGQLIVHHLPSGRPGDFSALMHEATIQAGRPGKGGHVFLESIIDVHHNGEVRETRFSVTHSQGEVELRVTFRNPADNSEEHLGPFKSIQEYSDKVYEITGERITVDQRAAPGRYSAPEDVGVRRGAPVSVEERGAARSLAQRVAEAAGLDAPARAGRMSEIHEMVRAMGLVGNADSLAKLTNLLNVHDDEFTPAMRAAVASATLEATRAELVRTGELKPGDDVLMLFRGVPSERMGDYEKAGIDLSKIGSGSDEDAGRGLYGSQDFESALRYAGSDDKGQVLPLIVRQSELRNVIDVRSGTPLGDRWLEFIRASQGKGRLFPGYEHLNRVLDPRFDLPMALVRDGRGDRFEAFLQSIKDDPTLPAEVRAAAADPHLTLMDLGGVASTGNDRGILTDQWAMHSQHIADLFNEAHGFPRVAGKGATAEAVPEPQPVMKSALTPKPKAPVPASDEGALGGGHVHMADEEAAPHVHPEHARIEAAFVNALGKDPAAFEIASLIVRVAAVDEHLLARLIVSPPHESMEMLSAIATDLRQKGYSGERLNEMLRQVAELKGRTTERIRIAFEHPLNVAAHAAAINALSPVKQALVHASPVALHLLLSNATTKKNVPVFDHYARLFAKKGLAIGDGSAFEAFVWSSVTHSKDPGITGLRSDVERLRTSFATYRDALGPAVEAVRLLSKGQVDLSRPPLVNWPMSNFEGLVPYHPDDNIVPGTRIDHVDYGRGTIIGVSNGIARISFDSNVTPGTLHEIPLADLSLFHARNGKTDQPVPVTPILDEPRQNAFQGKIDDYRQQKGLPGYAQNVGSSGTVSICRAGDQEFYGTNINLSSALQHFTPQERDILLPLLRAAGISLVEHANSELVFQTHAEAASLLEARQKLGSGGMPEVVELFVDRPTCWDCSANLSRLAEYLGIRELRIYYRNQSDSPMIVKGRAR
ncbi:MAG TPA: hypothetical protein VGF77_12410 [Allosphingosinicella sp.]|jgi:hypothetical protein